MGCLLLLLSPSFYIGKDMLCYTVVTPKVCYSSCHHQWQLYLVLHDKDRDKKTIPQ